MRETSSDLYSTGAANTPYAEPYAEPDHFFWYEQNKKKRRSGVFKCCGIAVVFIGVNVLSFYIGYIVSNNNDGSEYL